MTTVPATHDPHQNKAHIRRVRRNARRAQRVIAANFRRTAHRQGVSVFALRKAAGVTPWRMLWLWTGVHSFVGDVMSVQIALDMTVTDVFEGAPEADA